MVRRGLVATRAAAQARIAEGGVLVGGALAEKASRLVAPGEPIELVGPPPPYVSRAGYKLAGALDRFGIDPQGWRVLDAGASTGGFTDCLLQRGASRIVAVDVGYNQLHERLRADPRVENLERTNLRTLPSDAVDPPVDMVVADLSFISLRLVLAPLLAVCRPGAVLVLLVKPQFEAGREEVSKGQGIVRDPLVWRRVLEEVIAALASHGTAIMGVMPSPITGTDGNVEFVVHALAPGATTSGADAATVAGWIVDAVGEAATDPDADPDAGGQG